MSVSQSHPSTDAGTHIPRSPEPLKPSEVLAKAADLMAAGWVQSVFEYEQCFCLRGAICKVAGVSPHNSAHPAELFAARLVLGHAVKDATHAGSELVQWNDKPERTQGEVVDLARKASELAKAEGQ